MDNWNYFNYFTEIEEHFWKKRGAHLLVSPLDWAIMETWQKAGVPLEAALKGIDRAFESYQRSRRGAGKPLKSLAYCTDAVLEAAEEQQGAAAGAQPEPTAETRELLCATRLARLSSRQCGAPREGGHAPLGSSAHPRDFLAKCCRFRGFPETLLQAPGKLDLEDLERRLTILDEKIHAALLTHASEELMLKIRREVDSQLSAYRRKMKGEQLALVERQYSQKRLLDEYQLPRLSLYYFS